MGVDFYACQNCGDTYPDCGYYFECDCGMSFCTDECGKRQRSEENEDKNTCVFCRHEQVTDRQLLCFLLSKYNLTEEQVTLDLIEKLKNESRI